MYCSHSLSILSTTNQTTNQSNHPTNNVTLNECLIVCENGKSYKRLQTETNRTFISKSQLCCHVVINIFFLMFQYSCTISAKAFKAINWIFMMQQTSFYLCMSFAVTYKVYCWQFKLPCWVVWLWINDIFFIFLCFKTFEILKHFN